MSHPVLLHFQRKIRYFASSHRNCWDWLCVSLIIWRNYSHFWWSFPHNYLSNYWIGYLSILMQLNLLFYSNNHRSISTRTEIAETFPFGYHYYPQLGQDYFDPSLTNGWDFDNHQDSIYSSYWAASSFGRWKTAAWAFASSSLRNTCRKFGQESWW